MSRRKATHEEALRLIATESWCEQHTRPAVVAFDALMDDLSIDTDAKERGAYVCPLCELQDDAHRL